MILDKRWLLALGLSGWAGFYLADHFKAFRKKGRKPANVPDEVQLHRKGEEGHSLPPATGMLGSQSIPP